MTPKTATFSATTLRRWHHATRLPPLPTGAPTANTSRTLRIASDIGKYTGQSVRPADCSLNDLESNRLAGIFRVIWSNLCTRHIPDKLKPRGHHDWPDNTR